MSNVVKPYSSPEKLAEDERLRVMAQRALAPPDFPFDGLHIEAAMVLNQLELAAKNAERSSENSEPHDYGGEAS